MGRIAERAALGLKLEAYVTISQCVVMLATGCAVLTIDRLEFRGSKRRKCSAVGEKVKDDRNDVGLKTTRAEKKRRGRWTSGRSWMCN